jgi:diguanylate cyclase (GGDEF)-like protein
LDVYSGEVEAALALAARSGDERATGSFLPYRQVLRVLRGETVAPGSPSDASFDEAQMARLANNPMAARELHLHFAVTALLFRDMPRLVRHCAEVMRLPNKSWGPYRCALEHLVQALAFAERIRGAEPAERAALLAELDTCRDWLALRAADCPINFRHLLLLVNAERAWASGDCWDAARGFDEALRATDQLQRPWHRALIAERAGLFHLEQGLQHIGRNLMADARSAYEAWGATAKVTQLDHVHEFLRGSRTQIHTTGRQPSSGFSSDVIDLLAVLRASQALSSETSLQRLQLRVIELLGAMTGATRVQVMLWRDDPQGWYLSATGDGTDIIAVDQAASAVLPISAVRYAERTRQPLLVEDATRDGRFAGDPYIAGLDCCALLLVPILSHGAPRAMLLLENGLARGAFTADRLDAVTLIAGQLAVSFDNALLYASLERKVAERTEALERANERLEQLSITDPLTGLANRRHFAEVLDAEWERSLRQQLPIGVAMIDVDHFKLYNDHYGHILGDACLQHVAAALNQAVRQHVDLVARYGGEEFVIILPGAGIDVVRTVAERVRSAVAGLREPHEQAAAGIVTVSIGVAAFLPSAHITAEQLIQAADAALYEAKRNGRNQVRGEVVAPTLVPDLPKLGADVERPAGA